MPLALVPPSTLDAKQTVIERIKQPMRRPGLIQCPKCGSRSIMTVVNSSWIDEKGKYRRGTVCEDRVCYDCDRKGIFTPMIPSPPRAVKALAPKRTKPKAVP
ncbi:MAG: hypothetical protein EOP24_31965 [Hyphomicrobiales bacterium]|nr:MAG: hypothetical protein EOP24_31965 [Hyphomicrobiales bacterium]